MAGRKKGNAPGTEQFPALRGPTQASLPGADVPPPRAPQPPAAGSAISTSASGARPDPSSITLSVDRKKPRLAWQGMDRKELAQSVPTQVVEIVRPARAKERKDELISDQPQRRRDGLAVAPNRLIWTNDNLVALQSLLDEKDPQTGDFSVRGKVDLVYIDPPFMVNSDFVADNTIDIDLDDAALGGPVHKEPSLVEILAYKDTWRQGLDTFLSTLRTRLIVLKDLLAPLGSLYVHLDWHAVHYVKVLMDEIFGYENFDAEIIWKRTSARSDTVGFNHIHDTLLSYRASPSRYWSEVRIPYDASLIRSHYSLRDTDGRRYTLDNLTSPNPRPNMMYEWKGYPPPPAGWRFSQETMAEMDLKGLIHYPDSKKKRLRFKRYLDDSGMPVTGLWEDISPVNSQASEGLGYPTQKPVALLERIISASCPSGGLVLDCFNGSGTTSEAAERLGRRFIGIDNGKYAIHLARKRLIMLEGQPKPPDKPQYDYVECEKCGNIERKEKKQKSVEKYRVRPFTIENMGVYQRAEEWQDFQTHRSLYRDEMVRVFGGTPSSEQPLLHGTKAGSWVHVGPLDAPISAQQVWAIARKAAETPLKKLEILSADFDLASANRDAIKEQLGVYVTVRIIPKSAIDEVRRRIEMARTPGEIVESMAIPAFYAPLSIVLAKPVVHGRHVKVQLERCEVDLESFLASQRPILGVPAEAKTEKQKRQREEALEKWAKREGALQEWLKKATTWKKFVDFWAVDWDYQSRQDDSGKPLFVTDWQSFRERAGKGKESELAFVAEYTYDQPGRYQVAARVTDVFGNDGIATVDVDVK